MTCGFPGQLTNFGLKHNCGFSSLFGNFISPVIYAWHTPHSLFLVSHLLSLQTAGYIHFKLGFKLGIESHFKTVIHSIISVYIRSSNYRIIIKVNRVSCDVITYITSINVFCKPYLKVFNDCIFHNLFCYMFL